MSFCFRRKKTKEPFFFFASHFSLNQDQIKERKEYPVVNWTIRGFCEDKNTNEYHEGIEMLHGSRFLLQYFQTLSFVLHYKAIEPCISFSTPSWK
jgi:hypothetical protein